MCSLGHLGKQIRQMIESLFFSKLMCITRFQEKEWVIKIMKALWISKFNEKEL